MTWEILATEEFRDFLEGLETEERERVTAKVRLLEQYGPQLSRPHADAVYGSRHSNMKELRISHRRSEFRVFYAFDPRRRGVLLCGGDKNGRGQGWYAGAIANADTIFDAHLIELEGENHNGNS